MDARVGLWRKLTAEELMLLNIWTDAFWTQESWRRLLRVPWTARRSNQSILKEISSGCSLEGLMLNLKLQYFVHSCEELTHWKRPWCWEGLGAGGEGMTEDEMAGWHHRLNGRESEWTPGVCDEQGGLTCCNLWGCKESDTTEQLNWTELSACLLVLGLNDYWMNEICVYVWKQSHIPTYIHMHKAFWRDCNISLMAK